LHYFKNGGFLFHLDQKMPKLTVLYENHKNPQQPDLTPGHGFSAFVEFQDLQILFDTGWDGDTLLKNARAVNLKIEDLDALVISHRHWDHSGGIIQVLQNWNPKHIYLPSDYSHIQPREFLHYVPEVQVHRVKESTPLTEISLKIFSTGTLKSEINIGEQALILPSERFSGNLMIVGCLHPGLKAFVNQAQKFGNVKAFVGGMHGFKDRDYLASTTINSVFAGHCTQYYEELQSISHIVFTPLQVGFQLDF